MSLFTETVTLRVPGGGTGTYDDLGNEIEAQPTSVESPAWYEVGASRESTDAREQQVWGFTIYLPLGSPLTAASVVVIEGTDYQVIGEPGRQPGGFIVPGYIQAAVERVTG